MEDDPLWSMMEEEGDVDSHSTFKAAWSQMGAMVFRCHVVSCVHSNWSRVLETISSPFFLEDQRINVFPVAL